MISAIISLTALAMASASDRARSKVTTAMALGQVPNLTELIDTRGLKTVADQVNTMSDGNAKELMLRGIDQWLHRTVWADSLEEAQARAESDFEKAKGARVTLFETNLSAWENEQADVLSKHHFPIRVDVLGMAEPGIEEDVHYAYWLAQFIGDDQVQFSAYTSPEIHGPTYRVRP